MLEKRRFSSCHWKNVSRSEVHPITQPRCPAFSGSKVWFIFTHLRSKQAVYKTCQSLQRFSSSQQYPRTRKPICDNKSESLAATSCKISQFVLWTLEEYIFVASFSFIESTWQIKAYIELINQGLEQNILKLEELLITNLNKIMDIKGW